MRNLIITIDGPSGAGKSTAAKMLARALNYAYIDTGAMYRGIACAFMRNEPSDSLETFLQSLHLRFEFGENTRVILDGEDLSQKLRDPRVSLVASRLSQNMVVREYLYAIQREHGNKGGVVLEGRDTGSVVFPDADVKFYIDADPDERARRRHLELSAKGLKVELSRVKEEMEKRDKDDAERDIAPLTVPKGALRIDTTGIDPQGVLDMLLRHVRQGRE
jgi:CMP/dCMP kinase